MYLVLEKCTSDLFTLLKEHGDQLDLCDRLGLALQVAQSLRFVHELGFTQ